MHVRARLESARIRERYSFFQEISQNAARRVQEPPEGHIKLVLPYDGHRYFSRQARRDIDHARDLGADPGAEALVGHLVLTDFEHANLDSLVDQGAAGAHVPVHLDLAYDYQSRRHRVATTQSIRVVPGSAMGPPAAAGSEPGPVTRAWPPGGRFPTHSTSASSG